MTQTTLPPTEKTQPVSAPKGTISDRSKAERKLGWMLAGPAFFVMLLVTAYPMADTIRESLEASASRPLTPYYSEVLGSFLREYHPPGNVDDSTGEQTQTLVQSVLAGDTLL